MPRRCCTRHSKHLLLLSVYAQVGAQQINFSSIVFQNPWMPIDNQAYDAYRMESICVIFIWVTIFPNGHAQMLFSSYCSISCNVTLCFEVFVTFRHCYFNLCDYRCVFLIMLVHAHLDFTVVQVLNPFQPDMQHDICLLRGDSSA
jgi:hypothetical protein